MKVKTMLMIAAICFAILPMITFAAITNIVVRSDGSEMFEAELKNMASAQANSMQALLTSVKSDEATLMDMPAVSEYGKSGKFTKYSAEVADDDINRYLGDNPLLNSISLVDKTGKIIAGTNKGKQLVNYEGYADFEYDVLYLDSNADSNASNSTMFIKGKMDNAEIFVSYNLGGENSVLSRFTSAVSFYDQGSVSVVDSKYLWSSGVVVNNTLEKQFGEGITERLTALPDNEISEIFEYDGPNGKTSAAVVRVGGENGLCAVVCCPSAKAGFFANKSLSPIIGITILISVLSIAAAILVSRKVTKPLNKIEETLVKIRRGDHEARISNMTGNEYGQMSRAFNNVVDEIVVSEDRYKTISEMSDNVIFEWNFKTNEVSFSNNFNKKFTYRAPSDHFGDSFLMKAKVHPDDADRYRNDLDKLEKGKNFENNEYRIKNYYGDFAWFLIRTATLNDADGNPLKAVGVIVDIDRAKKSEAKLTEQASYDALTELYNRETIESQIDNEISLSEARKSEMAVLFIDVDDFKHFNDNYSHATGDQVLKFLAKTIKETVDGIGFAGRYGGDEFIAMIRNAETNSPAQIAQNLIDKLAAGFDCDGERLSISVSIGIAVIKDDYNTRVEYLIGKADDAMYTVKKSGKANYAFI